MWVIKIGGSLSDHVALLDCLGLLAQQGAGKIVLVPGGGPFADQVRQVQLATGFGDEYAHQMALHAMDQYGWMLIGLAAQAGFSFAKVSRVDEIDGAVKNGQVPIWLPAQALENNDQISQNWSITSDSLAAWLATEVKAEGLILIKRVAVDPTSSLQKLQRQGVLDKGFDALIAATNLPVKIFSVDQLASLKALLQD